MNPEESYSLFRSSPSLVNHEGSICHIQDLDPFYLFHLIHNLLTHLDLGDTRDNISDDLLLQKTNDIDGADVSADLTDGRSHFTERSGLGRDLEPNENAMTWTWCLDD